MKNNILQIQKPNHNLLRNKIQKENLNILADFKYRSKMKNNSKLRED